VAAYLLLWSPKDWQWDPSAYAEVVHRTANGDTVPARWSTGGRRRGIAPGDRGYLFRTQNDRGIVAVGTFDGPIGEEGHRDGSGRPAPYAPISWDRLVDPTDRLTVEALRLRLPEVPWNHLRGSGVRVPDAAERRLGQMWSAHLERLEIRLPGELADGVAFPEGAVSQVRVNRFERDPAARRACVDRWGVDCAVCGGNFGRRYGSVGTGFIQVHHVTPPARVGPHYVLDPERDLRPVCADCHAMLHATYPTLTIGELRRRLTAGT
jgi:5-methylcytosine-specific restriction protein A